MCVSSMGPVTRLTETWERVPQAKMSAYTRLQTLIDINKRLELKDPDADKWQDILDNLVAFHIHPALSTLPISHLGRL